MKLERDGRSVKMRELRDEQGGRRLRVIGISQRWKKADSLTPKG